MTTIFFATSGLRRISEKKLILNNVYSVLFFLSINRLCGNLNFSTNYFMEKNKFVFPSFSALFSTIDLSLIGNII